MINKTLPKNRNKASNKLFYLVTKREIIESKIKKHGSSAIVRGKMLNEWLEAIKVKIIKLREIELRGY